MDGSQLVIYGKKGKRETTYFLTLIPDFHFLFPTLWSVTSVEGGGFFRGCWHACVCVCVFVRELRLFLKHLGFNDVLYIPMLNQWDAVLNQRPPVEEWGGGGGGL